MLQVSDLQIGDHNKSAEVTRSCHELIPSFGRLFFFGKDSGYFSFVDHVVSVTNTQSSARLLH